MIAANTIIGGRYRVTKPLGGGGMKQVYLAEDLRLAARSCALAEMVDSFTSPDMQRAAVAGFQREADMLAELSHEHIPRIYDRFSEQNRHYLVMEFVDGDTLEHKLKAAGGKLDEPQVIDIALQVLDTLDYLHNLKPPVVYRDLKPSNIMITASGELKLVDFGIARHFQPQSNATMIGTQGYAPPEQYRGKVEARSDIYALGATMHQELSGRDPTTEPPFSFPPLRKLCPAVNPALADLIGEALHYDVGPRIHSAAEFKRRLLAIKIEALTKGLVDHDDAAAALGATNPPGKPQFRLPLRSPAPVPIPSPSAPTLLTSEYESECPNCARAIPADSRFCSYCAADLRGASPRLAPAVSAEAETVRLPDARYPSLPQPPDHHWKRARRHRMGLPGLAIMFFTAFAAVRLVPHLAEIVASFGRDAADSSTSGSSEPEAPAFSPPTDSDEPGGGGNPSGEPAHTSGRSAALRHALDDMGYHGVHFRLNQHTVELWGTVPSEADKMMVESAAFAVAGVVSLEDRIQVHDDALASP